MDGVSHPLSALQHGFPVDPRQHVCLENPREAGRLLAVKDELWKARFERATIAKLRQYNFPALNG